MKHVKVIIDRPLGTFHPEHKDMFYPVNYGYVPGVQAPDGEEQDAYVLGVKSPLHEFEGERIAIIHRKNDIEEKWVVVPNGVRMTTEEIYQEVFFQEQYFDSSVELLEESA